MRLRLTTRNWFFRWAYLFTTQQTRERMGATTLCDLFWRSVLLTPFQIFCLAVPVLLLSMAVAIDGWWPVLSRLLFVGGIVAGVLVAAALIIFVGESVKGDQQNVITDVTQFTSEGYRAVKERYCPLVKIDH